MFEVRRRSTLFIGSVVAFCFVVSCFYVENYIRASPHGGTIRRQILRQNTWNNTAANTSKRNNNYFLNALIYGRRRERRAFLTIGVPSMQRPKNMTYLWMTLDSLLDNSSPQQQSQMLIVIFVSDFEDRLRLPYAESIYNRYRSFVDDGLIQIIQAPREYYPTLENLQRTWNHTMERVKWRSKQNIDYAFMMKYSQNMSQFYLQLEDDVETVPGYFSVIKDYISANTEWVCLEFSSLGFIGKLYHSSDLERFSDCLILFYDVQPNDVIYKHFNKLMMQSGRRIRVPTIFQHHGYHSTLPSKKGILRDGKFVGNPQHT